ncbi:unnamed protein product [Ranitomeya imitator]|uniref:Reverse transcriptase domain-containing protein n=1 Tax=Ranitomeya imitator TaxID=111125 RepID=A0ABN9LT77_9NEOB|nr:unnamed protein product [Ranitomeya imitator]
MSFNTVSYDAAQAEEIISCVNIPGEFLHTPSEEIRSRDLERELRRKVALELHYVTLAEYHKVKRIPRGLHVSFRPTLFQDKPDFCQKFEGILNKCSMDIIVLTIEYLQKDLASIEDQITSIKQQLTSTLSTEKLDQTLQKTNKIIEDFRIQLQERKRRNFFRDTEDYHRNQVYKWRNSSYYKERSGYRRTDTSASSGSESDYGPHTPHSFLEQRRGKPTKGRRGGAAENIPFDNTRIRGDNQIVYNISSYNLSLAELQVLQKGLSFCPTPSFDAFNLDQDYINFSGSSLIPPDAQFVLKDLNLRIPSSFSPPRSYHPVETYIALVQKDIANNLQHIHRGTLRIQRNLSTDEQEAIKTLKENKQIVIKSADKGGSIVVLDKTHYVSIVQSLLSDEITYEKIERDPTFEIAREIREVHKNLWNPPGRPIVASTNSILSPLAITLDRILTPLLPCITSYLKVTSDFLTKLKSIGPVPSGCFLVTLDVNSLYTCIAHDRGTEAVQQFLLKYTTFSTSQVNFCLRILHLILHRNLFLFSDQFYIQKTGTAMGSNMAPPYANIFMSVFEEMYVYTNRLFQAHSLLWKRYIDDIFLIWSGHESLLMQFFNEINVRVPGLTFSLQKSTIEINFLDTLIGFGENGTLDVDIYTKPTDKK